MKKILILTITTLFIISLLPFSSIASLSEDLNIETKKAFTNVSFSNKTDEEIFEEKMEAFSLSDKMRDMIKKQAFDAVVKSSSISTSSSFFIESNNNLIQTDKNTYKNRVKTVKAEKEKILTRLQKPNLDYRTIATTNTTGESEAQYILDSGTLNMVIMLITSDNIHYTCLGVFQWETMPLRRHTDAFGLTRGDNLTIIGNSASGAITKYYSATNSSPISGDTTSHHQDISYEYEDLKHSTDGHAIEFNMPNNYAIETMSYLYNEVLGCISYDGMIGVDNIVSANHFAVYAHENISIALNSINFSISFPKSFSIGFPYFESYYIQRNTNHTWIR